MLCIYNIINHPNTMRTKDKSFEVNEYKIIFSYNQNLDVEHTRYFQSTSVDQLQKNLDQIIGHKDYTLIEIDKYNRWTDKWEKAND